MSENYNDYKIVSIINGKKQILNKCGPPSDSFLKYPMLGKEILRGYVATQYKDLTNNINDISKISYMNKKKKIVCFDYL
jgi:hypothetical protein